MNDMTSVIVPKSDQINADDLIGGDMTITIREVQIKGGQEQPVSIYFDGSDKAFRPCKSMSRVLVAAWGPDAKAYVGRTLQLYRDPTVKWGGLEVGGIRIRAMTDIDAPMTMALTATKGSRKPFTVRPLASAPAAKPPADDPAAKFAYAFLAKLGKLTSPADVQAYAAEKADQLAKLRDKRPELAAEVDLALSNRLGADDEFGDDDFPGPATDSPLPAVEATTQEDAAATSSDFEEGPDDSQRGEHDSLRETADRLIADAGACELLADLKRFEAGQGFNDAYALLDDDLKLEVDGEIAQVRARLAGGK